MTFGTSAHLTEIHRPASKAAVAAELTKLFKILGETDLSVVDELSNTAIAQKMLAEMVMWNARLAPSDQRDRLGREATKFGAAQTS